MVKLSLPSWDRDKSQLQAGTSFAPTLAGRFKSSASSATPAVLRRLKSPDAATTQPAQHPLMTLRLSSPSFLDSVVHDGSSDNPLYVIDTNDNLTKIRRSDSRGFVKVCGIRWPTDPMKSISRKNKDLVGVEVSFGKGTWKSADDFLGYSYSSLSSSYRKFYVPHHQHSLKWKPSGPHYACTTATVKGPVAILEPATLRSPPQLKILDPLFRVGSSRPQRMHNGLALSLLDFLLVTAMLLLTPNDEWMNVTRTNPSSEFVPDSEPPYGSSFSHEPPDMKQQLLTPEATPVIERWRSAIPPRVVEDSRSECGESIDDQSSSSRSASRLSFHMDTQSTAQHSEYPPRQGIFALSDSSLSLASHALSLPRLGRGHGRTRELPLPPTLPPTPLSHGPSFARGPPSLSSYATHVYHHGQQSQDEPPPIPPLPSSSFTSSPPRIVRPVINTSSVFSGPVAGSPTSSIHSRSLPVPPTPSTSKLRMPSLPDCSPPITPISALPGPVPSLPRHSSLLRTHSYSHLRNASTPYSDSPRDFKPLVKAPPNYVATPDPPALPISTHVSVQREAMNRSLSIRTNVAPVLGAASAPASADTVDADPFDMPPAYSLIDLTHSSSQLQIVNGEIGGQ